MIELAKNLDVIKVQDNKATVLFENEEVTRAVYKRKGEPSIRIDGVIYGLNFDSEAANINHVVEPKFSIQERFSILERFTNMVLSKLVNSSIICGEGGLGKSFTVLKELHKKGLVEGEDYVIVKGFSTPKALYRTLYENLDKIVVFDDCDSVLKDKTSVNILKGALDTYEKRTVSWLSMGFIDDGLPESFDFQGSVIFISNLPLSKIDQAVKSRAIPVDLTMTPSEKISRMRDIIVDILPEYSVEDKTIVLDWLEENKNTAKQLNIRTLQNLIKIYVEYRSPDWVNAAKYFLVTV